MSHIYTLPALVNSYGLTVEQWFDPKWNYMDPYKLHYYYRGRRVNLIRGNDQQPVRFEVNAVRGQANRPIDWAEKHDQLTVSEADLLLWMKNNSSTNQLVGPINSFGHNGFDTWVAVGSKTGPALLTWHIQNVINEDLAKICPELKEPAVSNEVSWAERISASLVGLLRFVR